jgi:hypothetical protein
MYEYGAKDRTPRVYPKMEPYDYAKVLHWYYNDWDIGICLRNKSRVMSALQATYRNGATMT